MRERFFCSAESRSKNEPPYGTVARIRSWLLLEHPAAWLDQAIAESRILPDAVKQHLARLSHEGRRPLLIRRGYTRHGPLRCFFVHPCEAPPRISRTLLSQCDEVLAISDGAEPVSELLYAVCTHARHDKCCAKFGLPVYSALRDIVGQQAWQCSHVGGDRFAGNVVVFPYGIYYGRVTPEDVAEIVTSSEHGQVWLKGYRGRCCYPRAVQVAEYFARAESGRLAIDEFRVIGRHINDAGTARVRFEARDGSVHEVEFTANAGAVRQILTCKSPESSSLPRYELVRYRVVND